jgi:hypothetical protein
LLFFLKAEQRREHIRGIAYLLDKVLCRRFSLCGKHREMRSYQPPVCSSFHISSRSNHWAPVWTISLFTIMMCSILQKELEKKAAYFDKQAAAEV